MKKIILIFTIILVQNLYCQYEFGGGMGLSFFNAPDLRDYINSNFSTAEEMPSFSTSADFFAELNYNISEHTQISFEYDFNIYSYNSSIGGGLLYDLQLNNHQPSFLVFYYFAGNGYKIKIGGGAGIRYSKIEEDLLGKATYSTTGFGLLAKAQGDTKLGENVYALIAGEVTYNLPGEITTLNNGKFNLNTFGIGLKLGIVYYF